MSRSWTHAPRIRRRSERCSSHPRRRRGGLLPSPPSPEPRPRLDHQAIRQQQRDADDDVAIREHLRRQSHVERGRESCLRDPDAAGAVRIGSPISSVAAASRIGRACGMMGILGRPGPADRGVGQASRVRDPVGHRSRASPRAASRPLRRAADRRCHAVPADARRLIALTFRRGQVGAP